MKDKKTSFLLDANYYEPLNAALTEAEIGRLLNACMLYQLGRNLPEMSEKMKICFSFVKKGIDINNEKYAEVSDERSKAARARWDKEKANNAKYANDTKHANDTKSTNDTNDADRIGKDRIGEEGIGKDRIGEDFNNSLESKDNSIKERETAKAVTRTHKEKHHHGAFKNVLLTDEEMDALVKEFSRERTEEAIAFFDSYIEEKGYKSKSHYLSIRRWVMKALDERDQKAAGAPPDTGGGRKKTKAEQEMDAWMDMLRETVEEEQNGGGQGNGEASTLPFL